MEQHVGILANTPIDDYTNFDGTNIGQITNTHINSLEGLNENSKEDKAVIKIMDSANDKNKSDANIRPDSSMKNIVDQEINGQAMLNSHTNSPQVLKEPDQNVETAVMDNEKTEDIIQNRDLLEAQEGTEDDKLSAL